MEDQDLPYIVEYAKSGRAACKGCKDTIAKDSLRLGIMVQSPHFDGKIPLWHHMRCFFAKKKVRVTSTAEIKRFSTLRYEDQKAIEENMGGGGGASTSGATTSKKSKKLPAVDPSVADFAIEYAVSSRSACRICELKIEKEAIRISILDRESEKALRFGPHPAWHHVDCFVCARENLGFTASGDKLPGFSSLSAEDKALIKSKLKATASERKRKLPAETKVPAKVAKLEKIKEDDALKVQSELIYSYRDALQKVLRKNQMVDFLEFNDLEPLKGESSMLDCLADMLAFGVIEPCPECQGALVVSSYGYKCSGFLTSWTKCQYVCVTPKRHAALIPEDLEEEIPILRKYKYVKRVRIFPKQPEAPSANGSGKPLDNFKVLFIGNLKRGNDEAEKLITSLGGKVVKRVDKGTMCYISTKEEAEKNAAKIKTAEKKDIFVIAEEFLDDAGSGNIAEHAKKHLLYPWGGDPVVKFSHFIKVPKSSGSSMLRKSIPMKSKMQKVTVHGKVAVDPESGLEGSVGVFEKGDSVYNVVLGLVDIHRGTNSYYKLQILKHNTKNKFYVFRNWGRVGTSIGNTKLEDFSSADEAIQLFRELYLDKTNNHWEDRNNFIKYPNRFYPLDIDYGEEAGHAIVDLKPGFNSKLARPIQDLICLIFDVEAMKKAMLEFEIDLEKMPLGKLSKKQIQTAYSVLSELQTIISADKNQMQILDASNRFYTLIPHDYGMKKPTMLDNIDIVKSKTEMLDSLLDMEIAYNLLKAESQKGEDPIDQHYLQLKTEIEVLDTTSQEYKYVAKYLENTHAETHRQYQLEIEQVFKINRHGESERYLKNFKNLHNKKLLWHGSRVTNFAGILSQGLRIAPPEAPVTGYMFGKGIYFADMVSKSANYCFTNRLNSTGLLMLCEVALGNMYELYNSERIEKLGKNLHSTKGLGATGPNPAESITENGVEVPLGKPVELEGSTRRVLLYNEYIVYDINQVNIKYLLRVNFKYR